MHQSPRPDVIAAIRFRPTAGVHSTASIASMASSRNDDTEANHWSVARISTGFFVRQSYG